MFGLSSREVLIRAIQNTCQSELGVYRQAIITMHEKIAQENLVEEEKIAFWAKSARRVYLNAVFDAIWASFRVSSPVIETRMRIAMFSPTITGLPPEIDVDYLADNGISAGATYAMAYFATTNKAVKPKDFKIISTLNHFQNDLMNAVLNELDT